MSHLNPFDPLLRSSISGSYKGSTECKRGLNEMRRLGREADEHLRLNQEEEDRFLLGEVDQVDIPMGHASGDGPVECASFPSF